MQLLNTRENRLNLYLADFSIRINPETNLPDNPGFTPEMQSYRKNMSAIQEAISSMDNPNLPPEMRSEAEARARGLVNNLLVEEKRLRDEGGLTPLQKLIDNNNLIDERTNNFPDRFNAGNISPIELSVETNSRPTKAGRNVTLDNLTASRNQQELDKVALDRYVANQTKAAKGNATKAENNNLPQAKTLRDKANLLDVEKANQIQSNSAVSSPANRQTYSVVDGDGYVRTDVMQMNPKKTGIGLQNRRKVYDTFNTAVDRMGTEDYDSFEEIKKVLPAWAPPRDRVNMLTNQSANPIQPPTQPSYVIQSSVVNSPVTIPQLASPPAVSSTTSNMPNLPKSNPSSTASSPFWSQVKQGMNQSLPPQTRQQFKQAVGQAKQRVSSTVGSAANTYNQAQQRRLTGIQQRQAVAAQTNPSVPPSSTNVAQTAPVQPQPQPSPTKSKKSKSFKGKVKTPSGATYEAEVSTPDWVEKAVLGRGGKKTKGIPNKNIEIPNEIVDSRGLMGKAKDFYNGLGNKRALLGGGAVLGGAGLLGLGAMKAATDRNAAESRARELSEVASRPPAYAIPPQPPQYNPYTY